MAICCPVSDLLNGEVDKKYQINAGSPFTFCGADSKEIVDTVRSLRRSQNSRTDQTLTGQTWWIESEFGIQKLESNHIYSQLLKIISKKSDDGFLYNSSRISTKGPEGEFTWMSPVQLLDSGIFRRFLLSELLKSRVPQRRSRVHLNSSLYMQVQDEACEIDFKQITNTGILLSTKNPYVLEAIENSDIIQIFLDTTHLARSIDSNLRYQFSEDQFRTEDRLRYFYVDTSCLKKGLSFESDSEFFIFCPYIHMLESEAPNVFREFMDVVQRYYKNLAHSAL
jgi:hypothetical protein